MNPVELLALEARSQAGRIGDLMLSRAPSLLRVSGPLMKLAGVSSDLAMRVAHFNERYLLFLIHGSEVTRITAIRRADELIHAAAVLDVPVEIRAEAFAELVGRRGVLVDGPSGADRIAAELIEDPRYAASLESAIRKAATFNERELLDVARSVEKLVNGVYRKRVLSSSDQAFRLYLATVEPDNGPAWMAIYRKIAGFKQARLKNPPGSRAAFERMFRGEASGLKGVLQEQWYWASDAWKSREGPLMRHAMEAAEALSSVGRQWEVVLLKEPMREAVRNSPEIYDGALLLARTTDHPGFFEAMLHTEIQIKAEKDITVLGQKASDRVRELRKSSGFILKSSDGLKTFRMVPPPGTTTRIVCTPMLADTARVVDLPPGLAVIQDVSLLDADQLDDVSYRLLEHFRMHTYD